MITLKTTKFYNERSKDTRFIIGSDGSFSGFIIMHDSLQINCFNGLLTLRPFAFAKTLRKKDSESHV